MVPHKDRCWIDVMSYNWKTRRRSGLELEQLDDVDMIGSGYL